MGKLNHIAMRVLVLNLLRSYLSDRKQCLNKGKVKQVFLPKEQWRAAWIGARFTSLPILNKRYSVLCSDFKATLFAKDAVVKKNARSGEEKITRLLESVAQYFIGNKLPFN